MVKQERGLGRGLSALMGDDVKPGGAAARPDGAKTVAIEHLSPTPFQPRKTFHDDSIAELVRSVKDKGVLQPLLVRPLGGERFEIVAGERRWRAAQAAGVHEVPVVVRELSDEETLQIAIIENVQREDLNAAEEAKAYRQLMDQFGHTQEAVAKLVGKSRSHVANLLRLLTLPDGVLNMIADGKLSMGHARTLVGAADPLGLARAIIKKDLSVRQAELLKSSSLTSKVSKGGKKAKDADTRALEQNLSGAVGAKVRIDHRGESGGKMTLSYKSLEQLDEICERLMRVTN